MIYLDNSATTYPKPQSVRDALYQATISFGANPGRGGYRMSTETASQIYKVRENIAEMFGSDSEENVVFTLNCTHALNMAIKGLSRKGGHAVTSCLEHNSVMRPLEKLSENGNFSYDIARVSDDDEITLRNFERKIRQNTCFIVCTYASNVFGDILPIEKLGLLAKKHKIPLIVDAAQAAGILDIDMKRDNISCLCMPGHKGLYGPAGTGVLIISDDIDLDTIMEGGTGSESKSLIQPSFLPDRFECGTQNTAGIIALGKGIEFLKREKIKNIHDKECFLIESLYRNFLKDEDVIVYNKFERKRFVPIFSFNLIGRTGEETASFLSRFGIALRGGFHCNPMAHEHYGTLSTGTARVSVSAFNGKNDINYLTNCINKIAKSKKV